MLRMHFHRVRTVYGVAIVRISIGIQTQSRCTRGYSLMIFKGHEWFKGSRLLVVLLHI